GRERGVGRAHRAPPLHRHAGPGRVQLDAEVGDRVGKVGRAFHRGRVDAVLHHHGLERRAGEYRLPGDAVLPGDEVALRVEPRFQRVDVRRPVVPRAHVVLARPHELDWNAAVYRLSDLHRLE